MTSSERSFDDLYQQERLGLTRLAFLMVGSLQTAEDIVADAFSRVLQRWGHVDQPGAYLRRAVVNGSLSRLRRGATERSFLSRHRTEEPSSQPVTDELWDAIGRLHPRQRSALVLTYYLDLESAEVARLMGCRPGTIRSLTSRALAALRQEITR